MDLLLNKRSNIQKKYQRLLCDGQRLPTLLTKSERRFELNANTEL